MSTYSYYQNRIIAVNKAYDLLDKFEVICANFLDEDMAKVDL
jgi:hypothetical protein